MHPVRQLSLFVLATIAATPALCARALSVKPSVQSSPAHGESNVHSASDLSTCRTLIDDANAARAAGDYAAARAMALEAVDGLLARPPTEQDAAWLELLDSAGHAANNAKDSRTANAAWKRVYDVRLAVLPDEHPDLQRARLQLAATIKALGDLASAKTLEERVLEVRLGTLPDEHPDVQAARQNLAGTLYALGDLAGARTLFEKVLDVESHRLPDEHPALQGARLNLAATLHRLGDLAGARILAEQVFDVRSRTLPDEHPDLQVARQNLAATIQMMGELARARDLFEKVLDVELRRLPDEHPDLQSARGNFAATLHALGELDPARALQEKVLDVRERTLPEEHPDLQSARGNLAATLKMLGQLAGARALQERVLEVFARTLPDDHLDLQSARLRLANTLAALGDIAGARALEEEALDVFSRTLPDDHRDLQDARLNLAVTLTAQGDLAGARALLEKVLEVFSRSRPDEHPTVQLARLNLAATLHAQGDLAGARALFEKVLDVRSRTLPSGHPDVQRARQGLGAALYAQGEFVGARELLESVLEVCSRTLPDDHPALREARENLAVTIASQVAITMGSPRHEAASTRVAELIGASCRAQVDAARAAILESSAREAEERCASLARALDRSLSFARGYGTFEPLVALELDSFVLAETTRGAALASSELARRASSTPKYGELREVLREASDELAALAQEGTTSEEFARARVKRESAERELVALARAISNCEDIRVEFDLDALAGELAAGDAAVAFRRYTNFSVSVMNAIESSGKPALRESSIDHLCAFVVRSAHSMVRSAHTAAMPESAPGSRLALIDLGPIAPVEVAVHAWRAELGVAHDSRGTPAGVPNDVGPGARASGSALRARIFDRLLPALERAQRLVLVLDDVLHLVPLDALPLDDGGRVGDRWQIETRTTLTELLRSSPPPRTSGRLVAFGDVDYRTHPVHERTASATGGSEPEIASVDVSIRPAESAGILRGSAWAGGFSALPGTGVEVRGIARCFADQFGGEPAPVLVEHANASRKALLELAPRARYLHIATHGWFAPESIRSWTDPEPLDKQSGLGTRLSGADQVQGMSPMLLCGLALAGANLPEDAVGRAPGLVTAEELSTLDLSDCEIVVLSACDTNVGERRAGQGVASLQKALQMAGARSVITSLWKVPDEATKELMLDFYQRLWVQKKPKWQALWEAKMMIRNAKDERGDPKYSTRDWAAWVLTGNPD